MSISFSMAYRFAVRRSCRRRSVGEEPVSRLSVLDREPGHPGEDLVSHLVRPAVLRRHALGAGEARADDEVGPAPGGGEQGREVVGVVLAVAVDEGDVGPVFGEEQGEPVAKGPPFTTIRGAAENFRAGRPGDLGSPVIAPVVDDEDLRNVPEKAPHHVTDPRFTLKRGDEGGGPKSAFRS